MKPCANCGGPKPAGRGVKLCQECKTLLYYSSNTKRHRKNRPRVGACAICGGPKVPSGHTAAQGQRYCAPCKELRHSTKKERDQEKRVERGPRQARANKTPKAIPAPPIKVVLTPSREKRLPVEIRDAWKKADDNSIIRRKFPTLKALTEGLGV